MVLDSEDVRKTVGTWLSLVERTLGVGEVASSNLVVPTIYLLLFWEILIARMPFTEHLSQYKVIFRNRAKLYVRGRVTTFSGFFICEPAIQESSLAAETSTVRQAWHS